MPRSGPGFSASRPLLAVAVALALAACGPPPADPPPPGTPRLVVLVVVDQMRFDYLERTRPLLEGGIARLLDRGVSFSEAHHAHSGTTTAPGHATLATGAHPSRHGVVGNGWRDVETGAEVYSAWDDELGQESPVQLRATTLGDWIKRRYPRSQVFAGSGKDRSAVMLGGHHADAAFWYAGDDGFETSGYYRGWQRWIDDLETDEWPLEYLARTWEPLPLTAEQAAAAEIVEPDRGELWTTLPRALGGLAPAPTGGFYSSLAASPYLDEMLARLALEIVERQELGADEWPDLLALSFSALDIVGHQYGPNSPEAIDVVLRLDRTLGELFDELDRRIGAERYVVALSSDHGVVPLPELGEELYFDGYRAGRDDVVCLQQANLELAERFGEGERWIDEDFYLDRTAAAEHEVDLAELAVAAARAVERCPIVEHAWTHAELAEAPGRTASRFRNSLYPGRTADLMIEVPRYALPLTGHRTTHGSPHAYDTHVPLVLALPVGVEVAAGQDDGPARTVDLAPTLAELLGVEPDRPIDGVSLLHRVSAGSSPTG